MEKELKKKIGALSHAYDFLHGGHFSSHNQLKFYDDKMYYYYQSGDKKMISKIYDVLKQEVPFFIVDKLEKSAGIRYFFCDDCHDAQIKNVEFDSKSLILELKTEQMLGCLSLKKNKCKVVLYSHDFQVINRACYDFNDFEKMFWISSNLEFEDEKICFSLDLEGWRKGASEKLSYSIQISDIKILEDF